MKKLLLAMLLTCSASASAFSIKQNGMSGEWYDPEYSGQGMMIHISRENSFLFGAVFTFDNYGYQEWFTVQGEIADGLSASLPIYITTGGLPFGNYSDPHTTQVGMVYVTFTDCDHGEASYSLIDGSSGHINLRRILPNTDCH